MINWFTKNHVAANVLMLAILIYGSYIASFKLGVEVEPSKTYPRVTIEIPYKGASPDAIESQIILPVEKAIKNLSGLSSIDSYARNGKGFVYANLAENADAQKLKTEIQSRVERISTFPQNDDKPQFYIPDTALWREVISVAIYGNLSESALLKAARKVRDDLTAIPGISKVSIIGDVAKEISIEVIPEKLNAYGLTFNDVSSGIRKASVDVSAGSIKTNGENVTIRSNSKAYTGEKFKELIIKSGNGSSIKVSDVATVIDSFVYKQKESKFNGMPVMMVEVMRLDGENALETADIVHNYVKHAHDLFPEGINLDIWDDDSISLKGRLHTLFVNLFQGAILVMILLCLFLRPKIAFWVTLGIPVSFAGAIICMYYTGVTANNWSLFGFIIVLGMVVDDAIVTGENIHSKVKSGKYSSLEAAVIGTKEVTTPVTFGIITTIVAFMPLMYIDDQIGNLAKQIPLVVIPVLIFSLIESKLILPAHLKNLKPISPEDSFIAKIQSSFEKILSWVITKLYIPLLKLARSHRYTVCLLFLAISAVTYTYYKHHINYKFIPSTERYYLSAKIEMKAGTEREVTQHKLNQVLEAIESLRKEFIDEGTNQTLIGDVVSTLGGRHAWGRSTGDHIAYVLLEVTPPGLRSSQELKNSVIVDKWNELTSHITGIERFIIKGEKTSGKSSYKNRDQGLNIQLRGKNEEDKDKVVAQMKKWLNKQDIVKYTWGSRPKGNRQLQVSLKPIAKQSKLSEDDIAKQIRTAFYGQQIQKIQRGEDEIKVMLRLPKEMRTSLHTLESLKINLKNNQTAPFSQFATISEILTPPRISRENHSRILSFGAMVTNMSDLLKAEPKITKKMNELCLAYPSVTWGYEGEVADYKNSNKKTKILAIMLLLALFALLAIPFKSFLQPLYVLIAVPFGVIGAVWGHALLGIDLSIFSAFGMLALAGIVVNDSLVLVDFINNKRLDQIPIKDAIIEAGARRFRPIILTSITTFAGLMPLIFETSIQAQFLIPMAVSLGFGILFATAITLLLIPCIYMIGEEIKTALIKK